MQENPFASPQAESDELELTDAKPVLADPRAFDDPEESGKNAIRMIAVSVLFTWTAAAFSLIPALLESYAGTPLADQDELAAKNALTKIANLFFLLSMFAFFRWLRLVSKNLRSLGSPFAAYSPGWAVGSWFVPFMNFYWPYCAIVEIWRLSDPNIDPDPMKATSTARRSVFRWWWTCWLLWTLAPIPLAIALAAQHYSVNFMHCVLTLVADTLCLISAWLVALCIHDINRRQVQRRNNIIAATPYTGPEWTAPTDGGPNFVS